MNKGIIGTSFIIVTFALSIAVGCSHTRSARKIASDAGSERPRQCELRGNLSSTLAESLGVATSKIVSFYSQLVREYPQMRVGKKVTRQAQDPDEMSWFQAGFSIETVATHENREIAKFARAAAHGLNGTIAAVTGIRKEISDLLASSDLTPAAKRELRLMLNSSAVGADEPMFNLQMNITEKYASHLKSVASLFDRQGVVERKTVKRYLEEIEGFESVYWFWVKDLRELDEKIRRCTDYLASLEALKQHPSVSSPVKQVIFLLGNKDDEANTYARVDAGFAALVDVVVVDDDKLIDVLTKGHRANDGSSDIRMILTSWCGNVAPVYLSSQEATSDLHVILQHLATLGAQYPDNAVTNCPPKLPELK